MKIVVISDIHANYEALSGLPEMGDELWALGDLVNYGPQPVEVIEFLQAKASVAVRGNHDHAVAFGADPQCSPRFREMAAATQRFTESVLDKQHRRLLGSLPVKAEVRRGDTRFYLCHAAPSHPLFEYCAPESERWLSECQNLAADVLLVGHTHIPFVRQIGNLLLINPGSLGQPKTGRPEAYYAVWENGAVHLRSFPYPVEQTIAKLQELPLPAHVCADLAAVLRTGAPLERR
jgi:putative phosphoesterase